MPSNVVLHLFPTPIAESASFAASLPPPSLIALQNTRAFICENLKTARRHLASAPMPVPIADLTMIAMPDHDLRHTPAAWAQALSFLQAHGQVGLLSEAGCPAVADPGAVLVNLAHAAGVSVAPHIGASSLMLALMASGLNGQRFAFAGYVPQDATSRAQAIKALEAKSKLYNETQQLIETPYRNNPLLQALLQNLNPTTQLAIALNLGEGAQEWCATKTVAAWRTSKIELPKAPAVFSFLA